MYDVDGVLQIASIRRFLGRLQALLTRGPRDRRSALGMSRLLRVLGGAGTPVFYLTAVPIRLARPVTGFLHHDGYPPGTALMSRRGRTGGWLFGAGLSRKRATLDRLVELHPQARWVLVGDDGGHDPRLFIDFARRHPSRVAVIALRRVAVDRSGSTRPRWAEEVPGVAVVEAPNGEELLPQVCARLGLDQPRNTGVDDWFLTSPERGNDATRLRAWTTGNAARRLVHGRTYFPVVADALARTAQGDCVLFAGWRCDPDELLTDDGPTVAEALAGPARRGALVRGLLWRSHPNAIGYQLEQNRALAAEVSAAGGEVLLDQRVRVLGSHHQKLVVIRHGLRPGDDVAFVGGIDLMRGARDDADHRGDPQPTGADDDYGPTPARHDVQVELRGPAVRDVEDAFRERWADPSPLARMPWQAVPDRLRGLPRTASPLPAPTPDPPVAGRCAVQVLRTYPRRRPPYPFAPLGERSIALGYEKALSRARRLVYVEDQYLWSVDVARIFAAALRRSPQLQLVVVVPYRADVKEQAEVAALGRGGAMAMVRAAGGDRVQIFDIENHEGRPIYVHAKLTIIDDVWAAVGSGNLNNRSWTHDSELTVAVLDGDRDPRTPADPAGLGDGARRFARGLRLDLMREHLGLDDGPAAEAALLDPDRAAETVRRQAAALDAWYDGGCRGPRPPGRLRRHTSAFEQGRLPLRHHLLTVPAYRMLLDPDGRPLGMRLRRAY